MHAMKGAESRNSEIDTCDAVPCKVAQGVVAQVEAGQLDVILHCRGTGRQKGEVLLEQDVQIWLQAQQQVVQDRVHARMLVGRHLSHASMQPVRLPAGN